MDKLLIIIFSLEDLLYQNILSNLPSDSYDVRIFREQKEIDEFIDNPSKIHALVIDGFASRIELLSIYARNVFSFVDTDLKHHIVLRKPIVLADFLLEIKGGTLGDKIFAMIDGNIYCELRSSFSKKTGEIIKLSNIENMILRNILLSKDFYISKESLQKDVWKYSKNAETTTIEQNMNKLRNTLPNELLSPYLDGYKLFAEKIY